MLGVVVGSLVASSLPVAGATGGASAARKSAENAIEAYFLADSALDWPAAMKVSSGLAQSRARYFDLVDRTADLPPNGNFGPSAITSAKVAFLIDDLRTTKGGATVEGSVTVSGLDGGAPYSYQVSDIRLTQRGSRWLLDSYAAADAANPEPVRISELFRSGPVQASSGVLQVRFEAGKMYVDDARRSATQATWAITVKNAGKTGPAKFSSLTMRATTGKAYTVAVVSGPTGPGIQFSGDQTVSSPKIGFGTADDVAARAEQPLVVWSAPGAFNGGTLELTYTVGGKPVVVSLELPPMPILGDYTPAATFG